MSPRFVLGRENVRCVAGVVNRSLKADCTDFTSRDTVRMWGGGGGGTRIREPSVINSKARMMQWSLLNREGKQGSRGSRCKARVQIKARLTKVSEGRRG